MNHYVLSYCYKQAEITLYYCSEFCKNVKNFKFINESGSRPVFLAFGMMKARETREWGHSGLCEAMSLEIFFCCLNMKREIKFGQVHAMTKASFSALLKWPLNCLSTPVLTFFFFLFVLCVGAYEGSGQVRVGPTNCVQRKKFKRLVTCTCIILPAPNSPIFCLCLDQKLMWSSYFCVASNLELHLALYVSCLTGLSPQIEPKILGWFLSRQPHPYLEGMLWLPAKAVLWKTHYSFSEVVFTG